MMEERLQTRFGGMAHTLHRWRRFRALAICWIVAGALAVGLLVLQGFTGQEAHPYLWLVPPLFGIVLAGLVLLRRQKPADEVREFVRELERREPEVRHLLAAAAEQKPVEDSGAFSFLQLRVIDEVLAHPRQVEWRRHLQQRLAFAQGLQWCALLVLVALVVMLRPGSTPRGAVLQFQKGDEIAVTPGDTQLERGTALVVSARFGGAPPGEATLVLDLGTNKESLVSMARRLADPIFGASIPEVTEAGTYHIEYRGKKTRDYKISIFEFPSLSHADAELHYPAYTGLTNRTIKDTLRISAVQNSHLLYTLHLNKPVASARWIGKEQTITLTTSKEPEALLPDYLLTNSARYALELVDAEGRTNKYPTDFILQALTNHPAVVKLVFPHGDQRVSRLEEVQLQAEASDDFGLLKYGVGFGVAGQDPQLIELGQAAPANAKKQFGYLIPMEKLGVDVDQVVGYFAWADDYDADGQSRRTYSDIYFADIRPFEEVFRADQSGGDQGEQGGGQGQGQGQGQGGGNQRVRLADLQKQIVVATWNLQREKGATGSAQHP
jgi:hypothetical protein